MAKYISVAPIDSNYNNRQLFVIPFGDVKIIPKPDFLDNPEIVKFLSFADKRRVEDSEVAFITEYEAEALGEYDQNWKGEKKRTKEDTSFEKIQICNQSLWLANPTSLSSRILLRIRESDSSTFTQESCNIDPIRPHLEDINNSHTKQTFQLAREVNSAVLGIERRHSTWMAFRSTMSALTARSIEIRFLLLWVALEALYGAKTDTTYRISNRIAFFISNNRREAKQLASQMRISYSLRSDIVHGMKIKSSKEKTFMLVLYSTENIIRRSLLKILLDKNLINTFNNENIREEYLDSLLYS